MQQPPSTGALSITSKEKSKPKGSQQAKKKTPIITSESEEMTKLLWPVNVVAGWLFNKLAHC